MKKSPKKQMENMDAPMTKGDLKGLIEHLDNNFNVISESFQSINHRLDRHEKILDSHTEMIGELVVDVQMIKNDLHQKVDHSEFQSLSRRVSVLESKAKSK